VQFDHEDILALVKKLFDGFKIKALDDYNPIVQVHYKKTKKESCRRQQQNSTYEKHQRAIPEYKEWNGRLDPMEAIHPDFMSEYASGPEMDSGELLEEWKVCMGKELGMEKEKMDPVAWMHTKYAEHIELHWRSDKVSPKTRIMDNTHQHFSLQQPIMNFKKLQTNCLRQQSVRG
jgi:hypothetical protein